MYIGAVEAVPSFAVSGNAGRCGSCPAVFHVGACPSREPVIQVDASSGFATSFLVPSQFGNSGRGDTFARRSRLHKLVLG